MDRPLGSWLSRQAPNLVARLDAARARGDGSDCDLLIIGSGYGGAVAAARASGHEILQADGSRRAARVWVLERGTEHAPGMFPSRFSEIAGHVRFDMQDGAAPLGRPEGLFDARLGTDVCVLLGNGLGGGSLINAGVMLEPKPEVFATGWPGAITAASLQDGYKAARAMLTPSPVPQDSECDKLRALDELAGGPRRADRPPVTVHWRDEANGAGIRMRACSLCGDCLTGCNQGAKGSVDASYLAHARSRGVEMFCGGTVERLEPGADGWHVHWRYTDPALRPAKDDAFVVRARRVILAAGTLGSTGILQRSEAAGLKLSSQLGKRFSANGDHIAAVAKHPRRAGAVAHEETDPADPSARRVGPTITGVVNVAAGIDDDGNGRPGFAVEEFAVPAGLRNVFGEIVALLAACNRAPLGGGDPFAVTDEDVDHLALYGFMGDDGAKGRLELPDPQGEGVRIAWPDLRFAPLYGRMARWLKDRLAQTSGGIAVPDHEAGGEFSQLIGLLPPVTVHPLGGCCMGDTAEAGVVDDCGRVFGSDGRALDGLAVLDGSIVPGALRINPALTIAALAERAMPLLLKRWAFQPAGAPMPLPARPRRRRHELPSRDVVWSVRERLQGPFTGLGAPMWARMEIEFEDIPGFRRALALRSRVVTVKRAELSLYRAREHDDEFSVDDPTPVPSGRYSFAGSVDLFAPFSADPADERTTLVYRLTVQAVHGDGTLPLAVGDRLDGVKVFGVGADDGTGPDRSPWRQLSEMEVRWNGISVGRWSLDLADLAERRDPLLRIVRQSSMPDALDDAGAVVLYALRRMLTRIETYGDAFKEPSAEGLHDRWPAMAVASTIVRLAEGARLTQFAPKEPAAGLPPLMLVHGLGSSGASYADAALPNGLVTFLQGAGRDVWVLDVRSSIGNESARHPPRLAAAARWTVEGVAMGDLPAAIDEILAQTGHQQVDVFAHCMGAVMFCLSTLGSDAMKGKVRAAVLSQVGPLIRFSPTNRFRGYIASYLQQFLRVQTLDTAPDFVAKIGTGEEVEWEPSGRPIGDVILQALVDLLLFTFPYADDDGEAERQEALPSSDFRRVRHRGDAIFGQLFELKNVADEVLLRLQAFMGWVLVPMLAQAIHFARRNMLTNASGRNAVLHQANFKRRFDFPLLMIHGRRNRVFDWRGSLDSLRLLMRLRGQGDVPDPEPFEFGETYGAGTASQLSVYAGYGHLDCIVGKDAHEQVFPRIREFFDVVSDLPRFQTSEIDPQIDVPWIGPVLGALSADADAGFVHVPVLVHPPLRRSGTKGVILLPLESPEPPFGPFVDQALFVEWKSGPATHARLDLPIRRSMLEGRLHSFALLTVHDDLPIDGVRILEWMPTGNALTPEQLRALKAWMLAPGHADAFASSVFTLPRKVLEAAALQGAVAPQPGTRLSFALASCQYPPGLFDERPAGAAYERLRVDASASDGPQFLVLCGDQVYLDETAGLFDPIAAGGDVNDVQDPPYDRSYELTWRLAPMRATVARLPVFAMLDDHEVKDNWKGVASLDPSADRVERALRAYDRYQAPLNPPKPLVGGDRSFVAYPAGVPLVVLDTRSRRSLRHASNITTADIVPEPVMLAAMERLLDAPPDAVKFLVSPSPILPPERYEAAHPAERLRSDSWSGFPKSTVELLSFIRDREVRRVVVLSGDAHLSSVSSFRFEGSAARVVSVVSSGLYTPWPFANQSPHELLLEGEADLGWIDHPCRGTMALHAMSAANGHAVITMRHDASGLAWLDVSLRSANGATTDCSVALD